MNAERKKRWVENWAKTRAEGRRRFILMQGILGIGVIYAVASLISKYLFDYGFTVSKIGEYFSRGEPAFKFFFDWLGFGLLMGFFLCHLNEYQFRRWAENPGENQILSGGTHRAGSPTKQHTEES